MHAACIWFGRLYAYLLLSIMYSSPSSFSLPSLSWTLLDIPQKTQFSLKQTLHVLLPSVIQLETFSKLLIRINMYTEPIFTSELLKEIVPLTVTLIWQYLFPLLTSFFVHAFCFCFHIIIVIIIIFISFRIIEKLTDLKLQTMFRNGCFFLKETRFMCETLQRAKLCIHLLH